MVTQRSDRRLSGALHRTARKEEKRNSVGWKWCVSETKLSEAGEETGGCRSLLLSMHFQQITHMVLTTNCALIAWSKLDINKTLDPSSPIL